MRLPQQTLNMDLLLAHLPFHKSHMHMGIPRGCAEKHKKYTSHSGCSLFAICPSTIHSLSDRKRQQEVGQCASLWNSFSITYLYLIHIKNLFRENPASSTNVYKLWFWKKKQKQYSTWVRVPELLISFTRSPGKVDEVLHADTAHFRIPIHVQQRAQRYVPCESVWGQDQRLVRAPGEAGSWLWQWCYKPPIPALTRVSNAGPLSPTVDSKLSTGGEDMSPWLTSAQSQLPAPLLSSFQASAGGGRILWLYWTLAVCSPFCVPFWSSMFQLTGCPGLYKSRLWLKLFGKPI